MTNWAARIPSIKRVWIFGSVAKGKQDPSDLDVAVELDSPEPEIFWIDHAQQWRNELQPALPIKLQLEWVDQNGSTPTVSKGLSEAKWLVYERAN